MSLGLRFLICEVETSLPVSGIRWMTREGAGEVLQYASSKSAASPASEVLSPYTHSIGPHPVG